MRNRTASGITREAICGGVARAALSGAAMNRRSSKCSAVFCARFETPGPSSFLYRNRSTLRRNCDHGSLAGFSLDRRTVAFGRRLERRAEFVTRFPAAGRRLQLEFRGLRQLQLDVPRAAARVDFSQRQFARFQIDIAAIDLEFERLREILHADVFG